MLNPSYICPEDFEILNEIFGGFRSNIYKSIRNGLAYETPSQLKFKDSELSIAISKNIYSDSTGTSFLDEYTITIEFPYDKKTFEQGYSLSKSITLKKDNLSKEYEKINKFAPDTIKCIKWIFRNIDKNIKGIEPSIFDITSDVGYNNNFLKKAIRRKKLRDL